ncbi:cytochrome P450 [Oceanicoccus sagamiensis]|uniref:Cytochrome n=1 Tax=Oceanicoccus sagamiensis TaxID=716816 RepID=A0A1X9NHE5_9GAMM|nr:cytochrome P450 [Oceanicoccus sagamiensis]ARN75275.1 hypothetical protein BST96_14830 [Oceanicoccus sagamiensis]
MKDRVDTGGAEYKINLLAPFMHVDPYPTYKKLRQYHSICPLEQEGMLAISRYDDIVSILKQPDIFSSTDLAAAFETEWMPEAANPEEYILALEDKPEHTYHRRLVSKDFAYTAVAAERAAMYRVAEKAVAALKSHHSLDFFDGVACPYAEQIINHFFGVDPEDQFANLRDWRQLVEMPPSEPDPACLKKIEQYSEEGTAYFKQLILSRHNKPVGDFVSRLLGADPGDKVLTTAQKAALIELIFSAGLMPVAQLLSHAILRLSQEPLLVDQLKKSPENITLFTDELLRYDSPTHILPRRNLLPVTVSGVHIPESTTIYLLLGSANRDHGHFDCADTFDIFRPNNNTHLSLGYGMHRCLGERLLKSQVAIFLEVLLHRFSGISCPPRDQLKWFYQMTSYSFRKLPVIFH